MENNVVEIVSFKLNPGVEKNAFLESNIAVEEFVKTLPGILYRSLCCNEETGEWSDIVYWQTMADAKHAQQAFMQSECCGKLMQLIDPESVSMQHTEVLAALECCVQAESA
ncbi:hypothetical protein [Oceanospirillum beijerinckii]|uniref:hypothetical protein n=1 Tax=Oceanospirillum beijerinckii TaxID=64976 RepID=UPI000423F6F4|nr:hypothetical protein [Oceanospirillum beijerinckii]MAC45675.1 hypothetical protein [Oceanospirillum sp.]